MGRIEKKFAALRAKSEKALIFYLTAGDPDLSTSAEIIHALDRGGVDLLEIGVPFSDPTADGPVIQAASRRALRQGTTLAAVLDLVSSVRKVTEIPVVLFGYYNPIFAFGAGRFAARAREAGVDGILVVDLPPEESAELRQYTDPLGIDFISLVAPTTGDGRMQKILEGSSGFVYYVSVTGVTGTAKPEAAGVRKDIERIRRFSALPLVVGFGISTPEQAAEIACLADGAVVGSAFVRFVEENRSAGNLAEKACSFAECFKKALLNRS